MEENKILVNGEEMTIAEVENLLNELKATIEELKSKVSQLSVQYEKEKESKDYWYDNYGKECVRVGQMQKSIDTLRDVFNEIADRWK